MDEIPINFDIAPGCMINTNSQSIPTGIRESVDSLCRDGANAQYMQYLSKSRITSPQTRKKFI